MGKKADKTVHKLTQGKLKRAEYTRVVYTVMTDDGVTKEDILVPSYWAHVGKQLKPLDEIEVYVGGEEPALIILRVVNADRLWAKVVIDREISFASGKKNTMKVVKKSGEPDVAGQDKPKVVIESVGGDVEEIEAPYALEYKGMRERWCIIRTEDKEVIKGGIVDKADAELAFKEYIALM